MKVFHVFYFQTGEADMKYLNFLAESLRIFVGSDEGGIKNKPRLRGLFYFSDVESGLTRKNTLLSQL